MPPRSQPSSRGCTPASRAASSSRRDNANPAVTIASPKHNGSQIDTLPPYTNSCASVALTNHYCVRPESRCVRNRHRNPVVGERRKPAGHIGDQPWQRTRAGCDCGGKQLAHRARPAIGDNPNDCWHRDHCGLERHPRADSGAQSERRRDPRRTSPAPSNREPQRRGARRSDFAVAPRHVRHRQKRREGKCDEHQCDARGPRAKRSTRECRRGGQVQDAPRQAGRRQCDARWPVNVKNAAVT